MGLFTLGDDDKMQYDDVIIHWVLTRFMTTSSYNLLCRRRRRLVQTSPQIHH